MRNHYVFIAALALSGCVVTTSSPPRGHAGCGPAHHWENGRCVHNGNANGHDHHDDDRHHDEHHGHGHGHD